jgi:two-component system response regulator AtoC
MGQSILLVEDHPDSGTVFARMLRKTGYEVTLALKLSEAREALSRQAFDLLICDVELPDGKGTTLLRDARARYPRIAAIVVSGHEDDENRSEASDAGFAEYFVKPIDFPAVCETIRNLVGG